MKGMWKKITCITMVATMIISMAACSRGEASGALAQAADPDAAKQAVFKEVGSMVPENEWFEDVIVSGEDLYVVWSEYVYPDNAFEGEEMFPEGEPVPYTEGEDIVEEEPMTEDNVVDDEVADDGIAEDDITEILPEDEWYPDEVEGYTTINLGKTTFGGSGMSVSQIDLPAGEYYTDMTIDATTGNRIIVTESTEEDYSDPDMYQYKRYIYINVFTPQGENIAKEEVNISDSEDEWFAISGVGIASNGDICLATDKKLLIMDSTLKKVGEIKFGDNQWLERFFVTSDGDSYVYIWTDDGESSKSMFHKVDTMQIKTGPAIEAPEDYWSEPQAAPGHDLYYSNDKGVFAYDFDTLENIKIMDYVDSDVDYNYINKAIVVDETRVIAIAYDEESWDQYLVFWEKVPPEEVVDKTIITMGMVYMDYDLRSKVIAFNKESDEYRIRLIEYYEYNNESDWEAGMKVFNNDIITSNAPDIVVLETGMPIDSFMDKGVLMNLNSFMEEDEEISKEDFAPNVLALGSKGDNTYILTASYMVSTMAMKKSFVPNGQSITLDELKKLEKDMGVQAFQMLTRDDIIHYAMEMNSSEFLDVETGKCNFNSPEFYALLEYAKEYPKEVDWESIDDSYWMESQYAMRENDALMQYFAIYALRDIAYREQGEYGEEVAFVGFPGGTGTTGVIHPYIQMAISADSKHPEIAWEFMREFYTYEAQSEITYGLPTNLKALDKLVEEAQQKPYWIDENGEKIEYDETYWLGDKEIMIEPLSKERAEELREYVLSVDKMYYYDSSIIDIIVEEAAPFFEGQKTAEQAAEIIQSRVQIYVNENR